jgi:hypothetical protein
MTACSIASTAIVDALAGRRGTEGQQATKLRAEPRLELAAGSLLNDRVRRTSRIGRVNGQPSLDHLQNAAKTAAKARTIENELITT